MKETNGVAVRILHRVVPEGVDHRPRDRVAVELAHDVRGLHVERHLLAELVLVLGRHGPAQEQAAFIILHEEDENHDHDGSTL